MPKSKISAVICTWNEETNLPDCLDSLGFADEVVIVDTQSTDGTKKIAKENADKFFEHKNLGIVEPVRNFAISKAAGEWVLIVDADERIPLSLAQELKNIVDEDRADYVRLPRSNHIFGRVMKHSRWWPDYNIRFFKKGSVTWQDAIHSIPITNGRGIDLPPEEKFAITHLHYRNINQYLEHLNRYTDKQSKELLSNGYRFSHTDVVNRPIGEFLSRFFAGQGYLDGFHGLTLSLLQAFSEFIVFLKVWEHQKFIEDKDLSSKGWNKLFKSKSKEFLYWIYTLKIHLTKSKLRRLILKIKRKYFL